MGLILKNGEIVTAQDRYRADIRCADGRIVEIGPNLAKGAGDEVLDASDRLVFPGGVDPHVHLELPFMGKVSADDFESGTAAGVAGGTTTLIDCVIPGRGQALLDALGQWHEKAKKSVADHAYHMALTWVEDGPLAEMGVCLREKGVPSFKVFMAYKGAIGIDDEQMIRVFERAREIGALVTLHGENADAVAHFQKKLLGEGKTAPKYHPISRPSPVEGEATARAIMLAGLTGTPIYVVHMTCRESLEAVVAARMRGQTVYAETCPQYLLLDDSVYDKPDFEGATYVMSPPIRPKEHQEHLWAGLASGMIQTVGTDHCPFNLVGQKDMGKDDFTKIPNGAAGIEHRLSLLYTYGVLEGRFDVHRFVDVAATAPAKIFGLYPRKGAIRVGSDADLVVFDPSGEQVISAKTHRHRVDRSMFEGFRVRGIPTHVVAAGRVQYAEGDLRVERGAGRFLERRLPWAQCRRAWTGSQGEEGAPS